MDVTAAAVASSQRFALRRAAAGTLANATITHRGGRRKWPRKGPMRAAAGWGGVYVVETTLGSRSSRTTDA